MNKIKLISLLLLTTIIMTACQDKEAGKLDNRVLAYWNFKINKDFKSAYQFLSPGWKSNESEALYIQRMKTNRTKITSYKVETKTCKQTDLCVATIGMIYEYHFKGAGGQVMQVPTSLNENWIMIDNTWYNVPNQ